jgi:hypothetical protein
LLITAAPSIPALFVLVVVFDSQAQEETGWKLVHGDVFRAPKNPNLLSVLVGSGVQLLAMIVITLCAQYQQCVRATFTVHSANPSVRLQALRCLASCLLRIAAD